MYLLASKPDTTEPAVSAGETEPAAHAERANEPMTATDFAAMLLRENPQDLTLHLAVNDGNNAIAWRRDEGEWQPLLALTLDGKWNGCTQILVDGKPAFANWTEVLR